MDSLRRGFSMLIQALLLAGDHPGLGRRLLLTWACALLASLPGLILAGLALALMTSRELAAALAGLFGGLAAAAALLAAYACSGELSWQVSAALAGEETTPGKALLPRHWADLLALSAGILPARFIHGGRPTWQQAAYLARPAMVLEGLSLPSALARAGQLARDNLLMMNPAQVGVVSANAVVGLLLAAAGAAAGWLAARLFGGAGAIPAALAGLVTAALFWAASAALGSLSSAAYHTCLYLWSSRAERVRAGAAIPAGPPAPLAEALRGIASLSAPVYSE